MEYFEIIEALVNRSQR